MSHSPVPSKTVARVTMTFPEAMQAVLDGKVVTKLEWGDAAQEYACMHEGQFLLHRADGWHMWTVNTGDVLGTDWVVVDAPVVA